MHELEIRNSINFTLPTIEFAEFERLREEAVMIADFVSQVEVTDENTKEAKRLLAVVSKSVAKLNRRRIDIKNEIMKPYEEFAEQVREIETIVKEADELVRTQVRQLEEREREAKRQELEDLWNKRIDLYDFAKVMKFEDWVQVKHMNKTQSISKSESEMTEFLEKVEHELQVLADMEDASDLIGAYKKTGSVAEAIQSVKENKKQIEEQREILKDIVNSEYAFIVKDEKDKKLVEFLLKENNINFELRRIK